MAGVFDVLLLLFFCFVGLFTVVALALVNTWNLALRLVPPILALIAVRKIRNKQNSAPWYSEFSRTQMMLGLTVFPMVFYFAAVLVVMATFGAGYYFEAYTVSGKLYSSLNKNMNKTSLLNVMAEVDKDVNFTELEVDTNKSRSGQQADPKVFESLGVGITKVTDLFGEAFSHTFKDIEPYLQRFQLKPSIIIICSVLISAVSVTLKWAFGRRIRMHWKREYPFVVDDVFAAFLLPVAGFQIVNAFFWAAKDTMTLMVPVQWVCFYMHTCTDVAGALLVAMTVFERVLNPLARNVEFGMVFVILVGSVSRYAETMLRSSNAIRVPLLFLCTVTMVIVCRRLQLHVQQLRYQKLRSSSFSGD